MISDAITMISESIANNDFLSVKVAKEVLDCTSEKLWKRQNFEKELEKEKGQHRQKKNKQNGKQPF